MFYFYVLVTQFCRTMTCTFYTYNSKKILKCILKHVFLQYYATKANNLLIIDLNNIHGFNTLKYILWILSKKTSIFGWHTLPWLCLITM